MLWCPGGEVSFVRNIIRESKRYWDRCLWFSSLVSRKTNLHKIERSLYEENNKNDKHTVQIVERIPLGTGRKSSTILMWSFLDEAGRREWARMRKWGGWDARIDSIRIYSRDWIITHQSSRNQCFISSLSDSNLYLISDFSNTNVIIPQSYPEWISIALVSSHVK